MDRGDSFLLLEVLGEASFNREHLPGAVRGAGSGREARARQEHRDRRLLLQCQL